MLLPILILSFANNSLEKVVKGVHLLFPDNL